MKFSVYIIRLLSIIQFFLLLAFVMHMDNLVSVTSQLVLICGVAMIIISALFNTNKKIDYIILLMYLFLICCFSYSYQQLINTICFAMMISALDTGLMVKLDKKTINIITISYLLQAVLLIVFSYTPLAYSVDFEGDNGYYLALGFSNPNTTGVVLFSTVFLIVALFENRFSSLSIKTIVGKPLVITVILLLLMRLLYLTNSRTSLVVCLLTLLLFLYYKFRSNDRPFSKIIIILVLFVPTAYYFLYTAYSQSGFFDEIMFMGKPLFSGREAVFEDINSAWTNHWFGNVSQFLFGNAHNISLTVVANIGIVGFIIYMYYYAKRLFQYNKSGRANIALLAIFALFIHGCNEAVMFTGGSIFYIYVLNICLLTQIKPNKVL